MIYLQLFLSYLKIGFFGFGGGYVMISLIQHEIVVNHQWITTSQLTDIIAISQMTPGPIAINCATFVGYTVTGNIWGSIIATLATCLPPLSIMYVIARTYQKIKNNIYMAGALSWMKVAMTGMIGAAVVIFLNRETFIDYKSFLIFVLCFLATWKKVNPILLIILAAIAGIVLY